MNASYGAAPWAERSGGPARIATDGPAALHGVPLVAYAEDVPIVRRYWRHVFGRRLVRHPAVTMPDLNAVKAAVAGGTGFSLLPRYLCADELASGALVPCRRLQQPFTSARRQGQDGPGRQRGLLHELGVLANCSTARRMDSVRSRPRAESSGRR